MDWDERSLRIVQASVGRGAARVNAAVEAVIPSGMDVRDAQAMGDFIRRTLGEHRIRLRKAIVDVPRQDVVFNRLSLPSGSTDELAAMVHIQIAKELPFSKEQAVIDFAVVPREGPGTLDVWVAAIRNPVLAYYKQVAEAAGLSLERVGLRPYANVRALAAGDLGPGRTVMVDVGPAMTEINIVSQGELTYTRAATTAVGPAGLIPTAEALAAAEPGTDPGAALEHLLIEVNRTIAAYRAMDPGAAMDRLVLAGNVGVDQQVAEVFEARFRTPTQLFKAPAALRWRDDQSAAPFSAVLGLALSQASGQPLSYFDFLHVKEPEAQQRERVRRRPVMALTVGVFAAALLLVAWQPIRTRSDALEEIKADVAKEDADKKTRETILTRAREIGSWQDSNVIWIDQLNILADAFPSNEKCFITNVEFTTSGRMIVDLAAVDTYVAADVVKQVKSLKDKKGKQLYDAVSAPKVMLNPKDPRYKVEDSVTIQILSMVPPPDPKKKKS